MHKIQQSNIQEQMKVAVAKAAIKLVKEDAIIGIGSGSTVAKFIVELATIKHKINAVVSSSHATTKLLQQYGFTIFELNQVDLITQYFDGADSFNGIKQLIKGGGGALTREKILAAASSQFICLADSTKGPTILGKFPVAVEVIPMARSFVAREIVKLGGMPEWRDKFTTDNGNIILDVHNWEIREPIALEQKLNTIPGVVENGIFGINTPSVLLVSQPDLTVTTL